MRILIGIQPSGEIHLGNYLGCIKHGIDLQKDHKVIFMVAKYHALTTLDEEQVEKNTDKMVDDLKLLGAETIIVQPEYHVTKFWKIAAQEPDSPLRHLPQYKSQVQTVGMLTYPILMAVDIMESGCDHVLTGEDQEPHMEYYRKLHRKYKGTKPAKSLRSTAPRIASLSDPAVKMSKSKMNHLPIFSSKEEIERQVMGAPTTPEGLTNLKTIASALNVEFDETNCKQSKVSIIDAIETLKNAP